MHPLEPLTVIVPTYNERDNLPLLLGRLRGAMSDCGREFEFLVVDDDSPDGTAEVARGLGSEVRVHVRTGERGLATAVLWGLRHARHDLCVCMDADLSHPPETIPALAGRVEAGARFSLGSRYAPGGEIVAWSAGRALNSRVATLLARPLTRVYDPMSGFFCCRRSAVPFEALDPIGYKIALEILVKARISAVDEVPIAFTDRVHGVSKLTVSEQMAYVAHLVRLYRWRWPLLVELTLFCFVGTLGLFVDMGVLTALVEFAGLSFAPARVASFLVAVSCNFLLNDRITFVGSGRPWGARFAGFVFTSTLGLTLNSVIFLSLVTQIPFFTRHYVVAGCIGVLCGTAVNFVGARAVAFRSR